MSYIYIRTNKLHISTHVSHVSSTRVGEWPRRMRLSGGCATNRACTASSASRWRSARAGCRPAAWRWCCYRWLRKLRLDTQKVGRYGKNDGKHMGNRWENMKISAAKNGDWWGSKKNGDLSRETWESTAPGFCCLGSAPWPQYLGTWSTKQSMLARRLPGITRDAFALNIACGATGDLFGSNHRKFGFKQRQGWLSSETWQLWISPWKHRFERVIYWDLTIKNWDFTMINRD